MQGAVGVRSSNGAAWIALLDLCAAARLIDTYRKIKQDSEALARAGVAASRQPWAVQRKSHRCMEVTQRVEARRGSLKVLCVTIQAGVQTLLRLLRNGDMPLVGESSDVAEAEQTHWPLQEMIKSLQQGKAGLTMATTAVEQLYSRIPPALRQNRQALEEWSLGATSPRPTSIFSLICCW